MTALSDSLREELMSLIDTARDELTEAYDTGITADATAAVQAVAAAATGSPELERHCPGLAERAVAAQAAVGGKGEVCDRAGEAVRNLCVMRKRLEARCTDEVVANKGRVVSSEACGCSDGRSLRSIFRSWERLRVVYNLVLLAVAVWAVYTAYYDTSTGAPLIRPGVITLQILLAAIPANLLFFLGPLLESYVAWLGGRTRLLRWVLFLGGMVVALLLEAVVIAELMFRWH